MKLPTLLASALLLSVASRSSAVEVLIDGRAPESRAVETVEGSTQLNFTIDPAAAAATARDRIRIELRAQGAPERMLVGVPKATQYRRNRDAAIVPVWAVDVATAKPWSVWRVFVDGQGGRVIRVRSLMLHVSGSVFTT